MAFSVLHISDLHRSESDPIGNDELLSTLVADRDRYVRESPRVPSPDAIVVSGDVIQGVPLGHPEPAAEIERQYLAAADFLGRLCDAFVGGDRSKIVITPGNHDVDWNTARGAMAPTPDNDLPAAVGPRSFGPDGDLRWCWKERRAYRITDRGTYEARLQHYRAFLEQFYDGVDLRFPLRPDGYYQLFELFDGRVVVAAFNSCHGNDCYSFHGAIPEDAVAQAHLELHARHTQYELRMAVWHHSIEGPPYQTDYMDVATIYRMIDRGFGIGLHGHQHFSQAVHRYIHLPDERPMAVVCAGSLCAGPKELPTGFNRQYNVLEFDDDFRQVRVHVREMAISTVFAPAQRTQFGGSSYIDMQLATPPLDPGVVDRVTGVVLDAERAAAEGRHREAIKLLQPLDPKPGSYARSLLLNALDKAEDWDSIITILAVPATADELTLLVRALAKNGEGSRAATTARDLGAGVGMPEPNIADLERWAQTMERMRS